MKMHINKPEPVTPPPTYVVELEAEELRTIRWALQFARNYREDAAYNNVGRENMYHDRFVVLATKLQDDLFFGSNGMTWDSTD